MQKKILQYIRHNALPLPPARLIAGVSGGADSVALLYILQGLGFECRVAHCNFGLRGAESDRDEAFVQELAQRLSLPFAIKHFDTKTFAAENRISIEMAARQLRYGWFEELRREQNAQAIAVAHHADDSVETALMNLVRGTGIKGLTGIKAQNGNIIRPLLCTSRAEIEQFLADENIAFVTDSSNLEQLYTRNRFRHSVLPLLEEINTAARENILACIEHLQEAETLYNERIREIEQEIKNGNKILIEPLLRHKARTTILHEILQPYGFNARTVADIIDSLEGESGRQFFSAEYRVVKDRNELIISKISKSNPNGIFYIQKDEDYIETPLKMRLQTVAASEVKIETDKRKAFFDADRLRFPLSLRRKQPGDSFVPFGMRGKKKLSDYFVDKKFSLIEKENAWLMLSGEEIIWLVGERTDNRFRVSAQTKQVLVIELPGEG